MGQGGNKAVRLGKFEQGLLLFLSFSKIRFWCKVFYLFPTMSDLSPLLL